MEVAFWLEVRRSAVLHYTVNQGPHWACQQYPGMARCWEMSTLPSGYIPQRKVTLVSSSGSLGFIMNFHCEWSVVGWLIVYQDSNYLYPGQYSQTICRSQYVMILPSGREYYSVHSWKAGPDCRKSLLLLYNFRCHQRRGCLCPYSTELWWFSCQQRVCHGWFLCKLVYSMPYFCYWIC